MLSAKSLQILGEMLSLVTLDLTFFPAHIEAKEKEVLFCVLNAEETVGEGGGGVLPIYPRGLSPLLVVLELLCCAWLV